MATATRESCLAEIGATAGKVWHLLDEKGSLTIAKLVKEIDSPRDVVMQALGWLRRRKAGNRRRRPDAHGLAEGLITEFGASSVRLRLPAILRPFAD